MANPFPIYLDPQRGGNRAGLGLELNSGTQKNPLENKNVDKARGQPPSLTAIGDSRFGLIGVRLSQVTSLIDKQLR